MQSTYLRCMFSIERTLLHCLLKFSIDGTVIKKYVTAPLAWHCGSSVRRPGFDFRHVPSVDFFLIRFVISCKVSVKSGVSYQQANRLLFRILLYLSFVHLIGRLIQVELLCSYFYRLSQNHSSTTFLEGTKSSSLFVKNLCGMGGTPMSKSWKSRLQAKIILSEQVLCVTCSYDRYKLTNNNKVFSNVDDTEPTVCDSTRT